MIAAVVAVVACCLLRHPLPDGAVRSVRLLLWLLLLLWLWLLLLLHVVAAVVVIAVRSVRLLLW